FVWPAYVANLRARLTCPVCLLVVAADDTLARWAAKPVDVGGGTRFVPWVLGPSGVPVVIEESQARAYPELAALSAIPPGRDENTERSVQIARAAQRASIELEEDRSKLYFDLIMASLSEAARRALHTMALTKYEYQSEFARHYVAEGLAQGCVQGEHRGRA